MNFVFFGVKKSGIGVFLVSVENGAGVKKMTNIRYAKNSHSVVMVMVFWQWQAEGEGAGGEIGEIEVG